jgi:hypothetical protein
MVETGHFLSLATHLPNVAASSGAPGDFAAMQTVDAVLAVIEPTWT